VALFLLACSLGSVRPTAGQEPSPPLPDGFVEGNNAFAVSLFRTAAPPGGNFTISPLGISACMATVYVGTRGRTADQITGALDLRVRGDALNGAFRTLLTRYSALDSAGTVELGLVNGVWRQAGRPFLPGYTDVAQTSYGARIEEIDFIGYARRARRIINHWCSRMTNGRIWQILDSVSFQTRLLVLSAVPFHGQWETPFPEESTRPELFWVDATDSVPVPTMRGVQEASIYEDEEVQVLWLPYAGSLSMGFALPREREGLRDLIGGLTVGKVGRWRSKATTRGMEVRLPRFEVETILDLQPLLRKLGMVLAFTSEADFSGMDGKQDLFVNLARHGAWVRVDEKGSETPAGFFGRSGHGAPFHADHPFLFLLRDEITGSILFLGQVVDPGKTTPD